MNIHGNKGSIFVSREHCYIYKSTKKNSKKKVLKFKEDKNYKEKILENFILNVSGREKPINSTESIFHVMQTALSIEKSVKTKKWEKI